MYLVSKRLNQKVPIARFKFCMGWMPFDNTKMLEEAMKDEEAKFSYNGISDWQIEYHEPLDKLPEVEE